MVTTMNNEFKPCLVEGCNRNAHKTAWGCRGYCGAHYKRLRDHGDPLAGRTPEGEAERYLENVVMKYDGDDCVMWPYSRNADGYGRIKIKGKSRITSRVVCEKVNGPPPTDRHEAAHNCGNGHAGCVTKRHVVWKTPAENQADRLLHGTHIRGEDHSMAKLKESQVAEIKGLKGIARNADIAERFGVRHQTVSDIQSGRRWKWVKPVAAMEKAE